MEKKMIFIVSLLFVMLMATVAFSAYHHEGENDANNFLAIHPDKAGTKLDHCALCHTGGQYEKKPGKWVSLGSCQWCHYTYGYDGSGNIIDTINPYGMAYLINGRNQASVTAIENIDSDGDGYTNGSEIAANRFPGDQNDDPDKVPAPSRVYTKAQLEGMPQHTQFMLMNSSRSGDFYAQYTGVPMESLLDDAGIIDSATGIVVYAPDGWSDYHPLEIDPDPELYHVNGTYPEAVYYYDEAADQGINPVSGWCDYSAPSCSGRTNQDIINVEGGLKMILAIRREGVYLESGILNQDNKLDGEGPFRVVPPQKSVNPPDQSSTSSDQAVIWPYDFDWDHNSGSATRSATIIKVEPLPAGTTDINVLEAGWNYVDTGEIIIYGAIDVSPKFPSTPSPVSGASGTDLKTSFSWTGGDQDPNDPVTYDIYLDTVNPPIVKTATDCAATNFLTGILQSNTTYFWKIVARDSHLNETQGPVWSFTTTAVGSISGSIITNITGQTTSVAGANITIAGTELTAVSDNDGHYIFIDVPIGTSYFLKIDKANFETVYISKIAVQEAINTSVETVEMLSSPTGGLLGDVNGDGKLGLEDVIFVLKVISNN